MAKSTALERLTKNLAIDRYEDRDALLKVAQKEAFNSRQGTYAALAYAYQWWTMCRDDISYLEQKFKSADIKVPEADKPLYLNSIIKLIFDLKETQYSSRVTEYALVLQYIEKTLDTELYIDEAGNPSLPITVIKEAGGIRKCAEAQRAQNNPTEMDPSAKEISEFLQQECTKIYKGKAPKGSFKPDQIPDAPSGFVMMLGRPGEDGNVDVVDVMALGADQVYALAKDRVLTDTNGLSDTLNVLGDALGYLHAFGPKEDPIVTVEKGGSAIFISLDNSNETSVAVMARPKKASMLSGFNNRAHMSRKDKQWFLANAQSRVTRRLFSITTEPSDTSAEVAYVLTNKAKEGAQHTIHLNPMTKTSAGQVIRKEISDSEWIVNIELGRDQLGAMHQWCQGWLSVKRKTASARVVTVTVDHKAITFEGAADGSSLSKSVDADTGLPQGQVKRYRLFGAELAKVIEQLLANSDLTEISINAPDGGLIEFRASDSRLDYQIDLPTVLKGDVNHNTERFTNM